MKLMENLKKRRANNKGFSLVELIIVIAIMAILIGIVGTQVIPYLNRSREAKDLQILNSYSTAAVSSYSINVEALEASDKAATGVSVYGAGTPTKFIAGVIELSGYAAIADAQGAMTSGKGKSITDIKIFIDETLHTITVKAYDSTGAQVLEDVVSHI